jgi:DNA repair photolyase
MPEDGDVLSLNLTHGCAHRCVFCCARANPTFPGDDVVYLYRDLAEHLAAELAARPRKPRAVFLSPATDPFPPLAEVQAETARVVQVLADRGIECWLMTRGFIRPSALAVLAAHRDKAKVTVALTTLDRRLHRVLEPLAAPPRLRLKQMRQLGRLGIPVQAALDPLIPELTDTRENLAEVLQALAGAGIRFVSASHLFLRPAIRANLTRALEPHGWDEAVFDAFAHGPFLNGERIAAAQYLPKPRRQRTYATLMALAAGLGIRVRINGLSNPDFAAPKPTR